MPTETSHRSVQCYHCRRRFEVGVRAVTVSCPGCHKRLVIEDLVIKNAQAYTKLQTCGRVVVQRRGHVIASLVEAHAGIEVLGVLEANAITGGGVRIGPKATWKGDLAARTLRVEAGARIVGGRFAVPDDPLGLGGTTLDDASGDAR